MRISEVAEKHGVSVDTLRYYERLGLLPAVNRDAAGIRDYTEEDCKWVEFVLCMRNAGLPMSALSRYVALFQQGDETIDERIALLSEQRRELAARIEEMQRTLQRLDLKIQRYHEVIVPRERELTGVA